MLPTPSLSTTYILAEIVSLGRQPRADAEP